MEDAIRALNGIELNDIYLYPNYDEETTYLAVGGGPHAYIVTGSESDSRYPTLVDLQRGGNEVVSLCVGGQLGDYPSNSIVSIGPAIAAARSFFDAGSFDCGVTWSYA